MEPSIPEQEETPKKPETSLEDLPGVGPATAEKLRDSGFDSYQAIAVASPMELSSTADIGESTASDIIHAARENSDIGGFETATEVKDLKFRFISGSVTFL